MDRVNLEQPLTFDGVSFKKEASTELPYDESRWILAITQEIHEQIPSLEGVDYEIELKKTDSERGFGYGIVDGDGFTIPIIIKDNRMMDLDVFVDSEGRAWPIQYGYLDKYLSDTTQNYGKLTGKKPFSSVDMYDRLNAPDSDRQGVVQETPIFSHDNSMLAKLHKSKEEIEKIADMLKNDPDVIASFKINNTDEVLKVALSAPPTEVTGSDGADSKTDAFVIDKSKVAENITEDGKYIVKSDDEYYKCSILTNIIGFDMVKKDYMLALNLRSVDRDSVAVHGMQPIIAGYKVGEIGACIGDCLGYSDDKYGCFSFQKDGKVVVFEPVTLLGVTRYEKEEKVTIRNDDNYDDKTEVNKSSRSKEYLVKDMFGRQFKVFSGKQYKGVTERGGNYYISDEISFRNIPAKKIALESSTSALDARAQASAVSKPVTIKLAGSIISVDEPWASDDLRAGTFSKIAKEELSKYYNRESIDTILKEASDGSVQINPPVFKKPVEEVKNVPRFDTVKIAAVLNDPDTVDKVLSLNFLNPSNLDKFKEYEPDMKNTLSKLADLLLASRLGMDIPSIALKTAMNSVGEVLVFISQLGNKGE